MKNQETLFAVVEKNSNRAIALIDERMKSFFQHSFPVFDIIELENTGTTNFKTPKGTINTVSLSPNNFDLGKDYHIIKSYPESITLKEAYQLINNK